MQQLTLNQDGLNNVFQIKETLNSKFESMGLPYRLYLSMIDGEYDEEHQSYNRPYVAISVNLKTPEHGYYNLTTIKMHSNMMRLCTEAEVMKLILERLHIKVNPIKKVHEKTVKKTFNILSRLKSILYISRVIKS